MERLFETKRMQACLLDRSMADAWLAFEIRNRESARRFSIARDERYYTPENFSRMAEEKERLWGERRELALAFLPKDGDRVIGTVALSQIVYGVFRSCFLGYGIDHEQQRKGYGKEAVRAVADYAFDTLHLHRIEANIMAENEASLALAGSLGFRNEGRSPDYLYINGAWEDHVHMVLLNRRLDMSSLS